MRTADLSVNGIYGCGQRRTSLPGGPKVEYWGRPLDLVRRWHVTRGRDTILTPARARTGGYLLLCSHDPRDLRHLGEWLGPVWAAVEAGTGATIGQMDRPEGQWLRAVQPSMLIGDEDTVARLRQEAEMRMEAIQRRQEERSVAHQRATEDLRGMFGDIQRGETQVDGINVSARWLRDAATRLLATELRHMASCVAKLAVSDGHHEEYDAAALAARDLINRRAEEWLTATQGATEEGETSP